MLSSGSKLSPSPKCEYIAPSFLLTHNISPSLASARGGAIPSGFPHRLRPLRRDMDCPEAKRGKLEVTCPPDDSLVEIFSRLHAKPLFRFKCVSKSWYNLIADRLRCRKFPQTLEGFFASDGADSYGAFIDLSERPVPLVDHSFSFLTKSPEIEKIVLLGSCNGLVLFGHRRVSEDWYDSLGYIVCNPATEEWVSVPRPGYTPYKYDGSDSDNEDNQSCYQEKETDCYLIFDPAISPHFQLIELRWQVMHEEEAHVFSSVTGAWRLELKGVPGLIMTCLRDFPGCPFNSMLHIPAVQFLSEENLDIILAVGGEGRPFRTLHWPEKDHGLLAFIGQSQGHLHCLSGRVGKGSQMTELSNLPIEDYNRGEWVLRENLSELSIWALEDYNAGKWVLRDNVSFSKLFGRMSGYHDVDWNVVAIHPDRGLFFFAEYWNRKLISYDMDKKEVCALCSLHGYRRNIFPYVPYFAQ